MRYIISALFLVLIAAAAYWFFFRPAPLPPEATFRDEFALVLKDYDGNDVSLAEYSGTVLVVYLFASWCPYCGDEMRSLAALKARYADRVTILAVNRAEPAIEAKAYTDALLLTDLVYLLDPDDSLYKQIGGYAMPETVFITARGEVLYHQRGPIQVSALEEKLRELVGE